MNNSSMNQDPTKSHPEPLVSVLVPSYNHEKYIVACLESIKDSSHKRLELIVSDDCSPDRTYEVAEAWARQNAERFERVVIVRQEVNLRIVKNLQFLFDNAQGEYLAYLASDDMLTASSIADRLEVLERNNDVDAVFGDTQVISESGGILQERALDALAAKSYSSKKLLCRALLRFWCGAGPVTMLRKTSVLEGGSLGRLPDDILYEDRYIYVRLAARGKLRFIDRVVAKYRILDNSQCRSPEFSKVAYPGLLRSDQRNIHLLRGLEKLYLAMLMEKWKVEINKDGSPLYQLKKQFWRINCGLLSRALFLKAGLV